MKIPSQQGGPSEESAPVNVELELSVQHQHHAFFGHDTFATSGGKTNMWAILRAFALILVLCTFPVSLFFCIKVAMEHERTFIFRLGRPMEERGPGIFFIIPCIDTYSRVDLRTVSSDVPPQNIISKDFFPMEVDAVVYYKISNAPIAAVTGNYGSSTRFLVAATLRKVLGTKTLYEILNELETINRTMQSSLEAASQPWGVKVERVEIKYIKLPCRLQSWVVYQALTSATSVETSV